MTTEQIVIDLVKVLGIPGGLGAWGIITFSKIFKEHLDKKLAVLEAAENKKNQHLDDIVKTLSVVKNTTDAHQKSDDNDHRALKEMQMGTNTALQELIKAMTKFVKQNPEEWLENAERSIQRNDIHK